MKRFLTTLSLLSVLTFYSAAENFIIQKGVKGEETYADGDTINIKPVLIAEYDDFKQLQWDPELYIKANEAITATVTLESSYNMIQFCGFDGNCLMTFNGKVEKSKALAAGALEPLTIDLNDYGTITETQTATVTAKAGDQTVKLILNFIYEESKPAEPIIEEPAFVIQKGTRGEKLYADGDTINIKPVVIAEYDDFKQLQWDPELYIKANEAITATVTLESSYSMIQFCGFDGNCQMTFNGKVEKSKALAAGAVEPLTIDLNDYGTITETQTATLTAKAGDQTVKLILNFIYESSSANDPIDENPVFVIQKGADGEEVYADGNIIDVKPVLIYETEDFKQFNWNPELYIKANQDTDVTINIEYVKSLDKNAVKPLNIDLNDYGTLTEPQTAILTVKGSKQTMRLNLNYIYDSSTSLAELAGGANAIALRGRVLDYTFKTPTQVTLYTIAGQAAISRTVNGTGSINLDSLPGGVYLYRAGNKTGKLIVR